MLSEVGATKDEFPLLEWGDWLPVHIVHRSVLLCQDPESELLHTLSKLSVFVY